MSISLPLALRYIRLTVTSALKFEQFLPASMVIYKGLVPNLNYKNDHNFLEWLTQTFGLGASK